MYDIIFLFYFRFIKRSIENKMLTDRHGAKIVVFRRKLKNLLLVIAINSYNAIGYVTSNHVQIK